MFMMMNGAKRIGKYNVMNRSKVLLGSLSWSLNGSDSGARGLAYDQNDGTSFLNYANGGTSFGLTNSLTFTPAKTLPVQKIRTRDEIDREEGGNECYGYRRHRLYANGTLLNEYSNDGRGQNGQVIDYTDLTKRQITSVTQELYGYYNRNGDGHNSGSVYTYFYELEIQTVL